MRPLNSILTGTRLNHILKPYLTRFKESVEQLAYNKDIPVKPLNIIIITDDVPSDDVKLVIIKTARKLDQHDAESWQIGIQFFQVDRKPEAAEELQKLDNALSGEHDIRDIVNIIP